MRPSSRLSLLFSMAAALAMPHFARAQQVVDLDAKVHGASSPLQVSLGAGCWKITPVAGQFTAWHAWNGVNAGCDPTGAGCRFASST